MHINRRLLAIIGKRLPAIYDVIPRGPQSALERVALNPQPLPPHELGAAVAAEFARAAWQADRLGLGPDVVFQDLDDWCPTLPRKPKFPLWWPPVPDPEPHPEWFADFHFGFAARLASIAADVDSPRLNASFEQAVDRSVRSIESMESNALFS